MSSLHLYCLVPADCRAPLLDAPVQPAAGPVRKIPAGRLAAVVSPLEGREVRANRANLQAHETVVDGAAASCAVLPMRFGVVVDCEDELVERFVGPREAELLALMDELRDTVEMRVAISFEGDSALREAVAAAPRATRLREKVRRSPPAASYYDRIELGRLVHESLESLKAGEARRLGEQLSRMSVRARPLPEGGEDVVMRAAFLVRRTDLDRFERALEGIAQSERGRLHVKMTGPLAPWDFAELPSYAGRGRRTRRPAARAG